MYPEGWLRVVDDAALAPKPTKPTKSNLPFTHIGFSSLTSADTISPHSSSNELATSRLAFIS